MRKAKMSVGNYAYHAQYWDWSGHDRIEEHEYWYQYAKKHGENVLIPMCAWGETGAYMAQRGMRVTAFDMTPEMIEEGRKHYGDVPGLCLCEGDVRHFRFDIPPVDFCFTMDLEVLHSIEEVKKALVCIHKHLQVGGCLAIKPFAPPQKTHSWPTETYMPFKQVYPDRKVWKTGHGHDDAKTRKRYISQTFHIAHDDGRTERFEHSFCLQCYTRKEWLAALEECGFDVTYGDTIEAIRRKS